MKNSLPKKASSYLKARIKKRHWRYALTALASVVVLCTVYSLIHPATALTKMQEAAETVQEVVAATSEPVSTADGEASAATSGGAADAGSGSSSAAPQESDTESDGNASGAAEDAAGQQDAAEPSDDGAEPQEPADEPQDAAASQNQQPAAKADADLPVITVTTDKTTLLTGETATTKLNISNPNSADITQDDGTVIRVYMEFAKTDPGEGKPSSADGTPGQGEGTYSVVATGVGRNYKYTVTRIPGTDDNHYAYCFEVQRPLQGDTISIDLPSSYPSPSSAGGTNTVWGVVLTKAEKDAVDKTGKDGNPGIADKPADGKNMQTITWKTEPDSFNLTKDTFVKEYSDEQLEFYGENDRTYVKDLKYRIKGNRNDQTTNEAIGKDYVNKQSYSDTMQLPDAFSYEADIVEAIEKGNYVVAPNWKSVEFKTSKDAEPFLTIHVETDNVIEDWLQWSDQQWDSTDMPSFGLELDSTGKKLTVKWTYDKAVKKDGSGVPNQETAPLELHMIFGNKVIYASTSKLSAETPYTFNNTVTRTDSHCWSGDTELHAEKEFSLSVGSANLRLLKNNTATLDDLYMGDSIPYTICADNTGDLPYEKLAYISDTLQPTLCLNADQLAVLFSDETYGSRASVQVAHVTYCGEEGVKKEVKAIDGTDAGSTAARNTNSDTDSNKYNGLTDNSDSNLGNGYHTTWHREDESGTLSIAWNKEKTKLVLTRNEGEGDQNTFECAANAKDIQSALDSLDFMVTSNTQYTLTWDLRDDNGDPLPLLGKQRRQIDFKVQIKDTFMMLVSDLKYTYKSETIDVNVNSVSAYDKDKHQIASAEDSNATQNSFNPKREFFLTKSPKIDGEAADSVHQGDVVDWTITVKHKSSASYDLLPLTDHMSDAQVLLAEKDKNQGASWTEGCTVYTDPKSNTEYYRLDQQKTYTGVWLNGNYADTVTVKKSTTGWDTYIKWYWKDFKGGDREEKVTYKALIDSQSSGADSSVTRQLNNECWLNDHQTHRLWTPQGLIDMDFDASKKIVSKDDVEAQDKEAGQSKSVIHEGDTVYYRLKINPVVSIPGTKINITGKDMYDVLPAGLSSESADYLKWKKGNSDTEEPGDVYVVAYQGAETLEHTDSWDITTDEETGQQRITWGDDFKATIGDITKPLYIYVRLTYPKGANWEEYCAKYQNTELTNTFSVMNMKRTVSHTLGVAAKAYLQKGVFSTNRTTLASNKTTKRDSGADSLTHYLNDDSFMRTVTYYSVVYNGGQTRLYIEPLQDILPQGFTFLSLTNDLAGTTRPITSYIDSSDTVTEDDAPYIYKYSSVTRNATGTDHDVTWVDAQITAQPDATKAKVTFTVGAGQSEDGTVTKIHYDQERNKYYLEPGEGIQFLYSCRTHTTSDTLDAAENSIAMPYYDFNQSGLELSEDSFTRCDNAPGDGKNVTYDKNDGSCSIIDNTQAESSGRTGGSNDTQWLYSSVQQTRGSIKPGITKKLTKAIGEQSTVENPVAPKPTDTLEWEVTAANDGNESIRDYTLTDTMQSPYCFAGQVEYTIPGSGRNGYSEGIDVRFTLSEPKTENGKTTIEVTQTSGSETLTVNGDAVTLVNQYYLYGDDGDDYWRPECSLRITKGQGADAPYTLSIRFADEAFSIPAGGTGVLTLQTKRTDGALENKVFVNSCFITPMSQTWDNTTNKGNVTTLDDVFGEDNKPTVRNSAPVTTAYGYVTSSLKSVEEKDNPNNKATSNESPNYIVLPGKDSVFTYTLSVDAPEKAMDKLILIDGLPDVGDHSAFQSDDPRFSEFEVGFADNPSVTVIVTKGDGTSTTLSSDQYTVEYSKKTEFAADDWDGRSAWDGRSSGARSLRVKINDPDGTLVPANSHVSVRFDAKIEGDAQAGQIAWNSFGYHYSVVDEDSELEAAPLKVGVMIPAVPKIVKSVVDQDGSPSEVQEEKKFRFLLYTGASLNETDEAKLGETLKGDSSRKATLITLTVEKGQSTSDAMSLGDLKVWNYADDGWTEGSEAWTWDANATYTLVELADNTVAYTFGSINGVTIDTGYTFTYAKDKALTLKAVNQVKTWSFTIHKTDAKDGSKTLTGAWFALYSPEKADQMSEDAYNALDNKPTNKPAFTLTVGEGEDAQTWYLCQVAQTRDIEDKKGSLTFTGLTRDQYRYREIQAPKSYELDETVRSASKYDPDHSITITNTGSGVTLPKTGGVGTGPFTAGGALLVAAALLGYAHARKRGGRRR